MVITVLRPVYFPEIFFAASIPWGWRSSRRSVSKVAIVDKLVAINLFIAGSVEFGKLNDMKVISCLKKIYCYFRNSKVFLLQRSIFVTISVSPVFSSFSSKDWKTGRFRISLPPELTSVLIFVSGRPAYINSSFCEFRDEFF